MNIILTILEFLGWWLLTSIVSGLGLACIMRFGLHYKPPGDLPALHPMPSGSMRNEVRS